MVENKKNEKRVSDGSEMFGSEAVAGAGDSQMSSKIHSFGEVVRDIHVINEEIRLQSVAEMMKDSSYTFIYSPFFAAVVGIFAGAVLGMFLMTLL
jgi:hypothetical protein